MLFWARAVEYNGRCDDRSGHGRQWWAVATAPRRTSQHFSLTPFHYLFFSFSILLLQLVGQRIVQLFIMSRKSNCLAIIRIWWICRYLRELIVRGKQEKLIPPSIYKFLICTTPSVYDNKFASGLSYFIVKSKRLGCILYHKGTYIN